MDDDVDIPIWFWVIIGSVLGCIALFLLCFVIDEIVKCEKDVNGYKVVIINSLRVTLFRSLNIAIITLIVFDNSWFDSI
jgi:hypothetical protein